MGRKFSLAGLLLAVSVAALPEACAQKIDRTLVIAPSQPIAGETRTALVVGNGAYTNGPLRNPVNDARAMANALGSMGFEVLLVENGTQSAMQRAVRTFGDKLTNGGVGLFYYAGHGIQARGRNYLVPVNAEIAREDELEFESVDVNLVLAKMDSAKNGLNIVILDACRNNPFGRAFRSVQVGLAQIDAPTGTFIAFATAPGSVAADGSGDNGVYTKHLLAEMDAPGLAIEQMFKQVRNGVMAETRGRQIPWESSSLRGEFAFRPGAQPSVAEAVAEAVRREREAQRRETEKLVAAALERQRVQLEALGLSLSDPGKKPALPEKQTPTITTSFAPPASASTASNSRRPTTGDTWTYRLTEPRNPTGPRQRQYVVTALAVTGSGVLDRYKLDGAAEGEWAHNAHAYLVTLGPSIFSPYLDAIGYVPASGRLERVQIQDTGCVREYVCDASAVAAGRERVSTVAGTFDALKVVVEQSWRLSQQHPMTPNINGARRLTVWYAPAVKRAVKFSSRTTFGGYAPLEPDFDLELVSYRVQ